MFFIIIFYSFVPFGFDEEGQWLFYYSVDGIQLSLSSLHPFLHFICIFHVVHEYKLLQVNNASVLNSIHSTTAQTNCKKPEETK